MGTVLSAPRGLREQIALTVAEANSCDYCLAAHSLVGKATGLTSDAIFAARRGEATDMKIDALIKFTAAVDQTHGQVSDEALAAVRVAGISDTEIIETVAHGKATRRRAAGSISGTGD